MTQNPPGTDGAAAPGEHDRTAAAILDAIAETRPEPEKMVLLLLSGCIKVGPAATTKLAMHCGPFAEQMLADLSE